MNVSNIFKIILLINKKIGDPMKIVGFNVTGLRKLTAVEMKFAKTGLTQVRAKNQQGKSTVLDAIELLIKGKRYLRDDMIQHGKKKAEIAGQIGGWEIKRVFTANSDRLEITDINTGIPHTKSPQGFLDTFVNELTFDPLPFVQKSSNDKLLFVMDLCNIDFTQIDKDILVAENDRLLAGRDLKTHGVPEEKEKVEPVSISDLTLELTQKQKLITVIETREQFLTDTQYEINNIEVKIKELKEELEITKNGYAQEVDILKELGKKPGLAPIQQKIEDAEEINEKATEYKTYLTDTEAFDKLTDVHEFLDSKVKTLRSLKKGKLEDAEIPVEGLEIREDGLYFHSTRSENWSDQQNYEISAKLCLAMKPELQAIFLDRGETYDKESLIMLHEWAKENDLQAIITIVDDDIEESVEGVVYYLEEGKVV